MTHLQRTLIVLSMVVTCSHPLCGEDTEEGTKKTIEAPSPDGQFAFRYTQESDSEKQTYDLIAEGSRKVLMSVAESNPDLGPSARFNMGVLWRPDSKAFALTATLWKRGSVNELNSQSAMRWQKDGSLVVEIENIVDGDEGSVTATRTVVLGFDRSDKAKVLKSTTKFAVEKP
jgi:hypothetical protein